MCMPHLYLVFFYLVLSIFSTVHFHQLVSSKELAFISLNYISSQLKINCNNNTVIIFTALNT